MRNRWIAFFSGFMTMAGLAVIGLTTMPDVHQGGQPRPCFGSPADVSMHATMREWAERYLAGEFTGGSAGEHLAYKAKVADLRSEGVDVDTYMARWLGGNQVPIGPYAGAYIPSHCYAEERIGGGVVYWSRSGDADRPAFVENPTMAALRADGRTPRYPEH